MAAMTLRRAAAALAAIVAGPLALGACVPMHKVQTLPSPDRSFLLIVDFIKGPFGTEDVVISLEESRGLATSIARFKNIQAFNAGWLGPEDIGVCQMGTVVGYKTHVVINGHKGNQDFYIHYKCPIG